MNPGTEQRKLAAIMFTDMVGYSALAQRNETLALELLEEHRCLLRSLFPRHNGTEVKTIGDAFLVEFSSALEAAQCAIEIQRTLAKRNPDAPAERRIQVRIGIHIGDVVHREGDVYGDGVNIASRIEQVAGPSGICISMDVERQIRHALEASLVKLPPAELKNIQVPMDLFRIVLPWEKAPPAGSAPGTHERRELKKPLATVAVVLVVLAVLGSAGWWFYHHSGSSARPAGTGPAPATPAKSVAVLPFVNMSSDKENEYLSDGLTEDLCTALTQVKGLRVPARTSCFAFKGKTDDIRRIGEQLSVATVLEGSVTKAGSRLRINAQLIDVANGFHLWATNYDREMADILEIRSEIAQQVVAALKVQLGVDETHALGKKPTENVEAYKLYLLGRYHYGKYSADGWNKALDYFNQAIEKDPNYALAYAGKADAYNYLASTGLPAREALANGKTAAQKALEIDDTLAEAHVAMGSVRFYGWDWKEAEKEFQRAIQLNPNLALARDGYADLLATQERFNEGIREQQRAIELDPLSSFMNVDLGWDFFSARQYERAIEQTRKTLELDQNFAEGHRLLGWCFIMKGQTNEALAEMLKVKSLDDMPWNTAGLACAYAISGKTNEAFRIMQEWDTAPQPRHVAPSSRALVYLGLGDTNSALTWLEQAYEAGDTWCPWFNIDPALDSVRSHPRFQAILKKMNLVK
ncbi:MAG: adenylate/guanylate cyclase domain-containing protein [Verrucomicrobiota bacterium]|jgi:TolB-like protein/class 3 adenylate cyclase/Flp pilus assembly protein TadD